MTLIAMHLHGVCIGGFAAWMDSSGRDAPRAGGSLGLPISPAWTQNEVFLQSGEFRSSTLAT